MRGAEGGEAAVDGRGQGAGGRVQEQEGWGIIIDRVIIVIRRIIMVQVEVDGGGLLGSSESLKGQS